ncbi:MAG: sensor histidine kinase [Bdellovibrionales bacterium]
MEPARPIVQLLSNAEAPPWWRKLSDNSSLDCDWLLSSKPDSQAAVILVTRRDLLDFSPEEFSPSKVYVIVDEKWTAQNLRRALSYLRGSLFLDSEAPQVEAERIIRVGLARQGERAGHARMVQEVREQNRQVEKFNSGLERAVAERTESEVASRRAIQQNISRMREIILFIKELSQLVEIIEIVPMLKKHLRDHHLVDAPVLFVPKAERSGDIYFTQGFEGLKRRVRGEWNSSARMRVNDGKDSLFLANALGRPFGKVIAIPLVTPRHQAHLDRAPVLFFEHKFDLGEADEAINRLRDKLQPVGWALDRLILEQELKATSKDWEMTFDELPEPIAIIDNDGTVLRSNSQWRPEYASAVNQGQNRIRSEELLFVVERYPIRVSQDSHPISWVVYLRDDTRSRKLKSQAIQLEKMSAIGQLAGHIAHELNNPLTGIRSLSQVLVGEVEKDSQLANDLVEVEKASARCQAIINNLLDFSSGAVETKVQTLDLNEVVNKTLPFLKSALGRFRTDVELAPESLPIRVEPHLLQQVIFNLVNNACQAVPESGEVWVRTYRDGDHVFLEVEDSGPGIPEHLRERVFEPFFTTKAEGEGTGLGLSMSRDFVRQFGGDLVCEVGAHQGALFRVQLKAEIT